MRLLTAKLKAAEEAVVKMRDELAERVGAAEPGAPRPHTTALRQDKTRAASEAAARDLLEQNKKLKREFQTLKARAAHASRATARGTLVNTRVHRPTLKRRERRRPRAKQSRSSCAHSSKRPARR